MFILAAILVLILGVLLHQERTRNQALEGLVKQLSSLAEEQGTVAFILSRNGGDITSNTGDTIRQVLSCLRGAVTSLSDVSKMQNCSVQQTEMLLSDLKTKLHKASDMVNAECILAHGIRLKLQELIISINVFQKYDSLFYETLDKAKGHIASAQTLLRLKDYPGAKLHTEWIVPNLEYTGRFPSAGLPLPDSPEPEIIAPARAANMSGTLD